MCRCKELFYFLFLKFFLTSRQDRRIIHRFCLSLCSILFIFTLSASKTFAQNEAADSSPISQPKSNEKIANPSLKKVFVRSSFGLSYISWIELVDLDSSTQSDRSFAQFRGPAVTFERSIFNKKFTGYILEFSGLFGQANIGGSQTVLTYQESNKSYFGVLGSGRIAYRLSAPITLSVGPSILYRQVQVPSSNGITAKSGADFNLGLQASLSAKLNRRWELKQSFGTLFFKASTIWSLAAVYQF